MERTQTLAEYLKQLRKSKHYRQEDVASHLHISRQSYSHYETGRIKPSIIVLYQLAKFYGVSADDILEHIDSSLPEQETKKTEKTDIEKEFFSCLHNLNEKNRAETLSIMWEIVQAKMIKQELENAKG